MLPSLLHPRGGNGPNALVEVELLPFRFQPLACAGRCEDREFKCHRTDEHVGFGEGQHQS